MLVLGVSPIPAQTAQCSLCFYGPDNMAFDRRGNLYVTDSDGRHRSRLLYLSSQGVRLWQWSGFTDAAGAHNGPEGLALDASGDILVTDGGVPRVLRIAPMARIIATIGPPAVRFAALGHLAVSSSGRIYVADSGANAIYAFGPNGALQSTWRLTRGAPETIAVQPNGNLVIEDWRNRRIVVAGPDGRVRFSFGGIGRERGRFLSTAGIGVDSTGDIYVADIGEHRIQKFDARGRFLRVIGSGLFDKDGPSAVAVSADGTLYSPDGRSILKYTEDGILVARFR